MRLNLVKSILFFTLLVTNADALEVSVAFGEKLPPFIIPETNSGIELDIVREALAVKGHTLKPVYLPMARITATFKNRKVDVAMMDVGEEMKDHGGFYGEAPVLYDNVFITLKKRNFTIKRPSDVMSF